MDESERLIAIAAMAGAERASLAWKQWLATNDIAEASGTLVWSAGYIQRNLAAVGVEDRYLAGIARHNWIANNRRIVLALPTIRALSALGPLTPMKSFGMSAEHYSRGLRPSTDFDFYLPEGSIRTAIDELLARGFEPNLGLSIEELEERVIPQRGSWNFVNAEGVDLDLHWRLLDHVPTALSDALVAANSRAETTEFGSIRRLDPELMLVCLAVHHVTQGGSTWNGVFDVNHLLRSVDPHRVARLAQRTGVPFEVARLVRELRELLDADASPELRALDAAFARATRPRSAASVRRIVGRRRVLRSRGLRERSMFARPALARLWASVGRPVGLERALRRFGPIMRRHRADDAVGLPRGGARLGPGWNHLFPGDPHRWADRPDARVLFEGVPAGCRELVIEFSPNEWAISPTARVLVVVDGRELGICDHDSSSYRFTVLEHDGTVEVSLRVAPGDRLPPTPIISRQWHGMLAPVRSITLE